MQRCPPAAVPQLATSDQQRGLRDNVAHLGRRLYPERLDVPQQAVVCDPEIAEGDHALLGQRGHRVNAHHGVVARRHTSGRRLHQTVPHGRHDSFCQSVFLSNAYLITAPVKA